MSKLKLNAGLEVSGRAYGSGDDEGIVITDAGNGYSGLVLGSTTGRRSVFYLSSDNAFWRYNNGNSNYDLLHPSKNGTIATTSDLTWDNISGKPSTFTPSSHTHTNITDGTMALYSEYNNEINFGGTNSSETIYFGYRAKDSKPIPTKFVFGGTTGTARILAARADVGAIILTNDSWTGYGTNNPASAADPIEGRVYFKVI